MKAANYKKSVTITITHPFFNGASEGLYRFEMMPRGMLSSKRGVFRLRYRGNRVTVLRDWEPGHKSVPKFVDIAVYPSDPFFHNLSGLETDYTQGMSYYLSDSARVTEGGGGTRGMILVDTQTKEEYEAVPVRFCDRKFVFPVDASEGDVFTLTDRDRRSVRTWQFEESSSQELFMDMGKWPDGLYFLEKNKAVEARFYVSDSNWNKKETQSRGITKEEPPPAFIIGIQTGADAADFQVALAARSAVWHYFIHARSNSRKLGNLVIKNNNQPLLPDVTFERQQVDQEQRQVIFTSSRPIVLMARGYREIELYENSEAGTPLIHHLPNAGASSLHFIDGQWVAHMHVNI